MRRLSSAILALLLPLACGDASTPLGPGPAEDVGPVFEVGPSDDAGPTGEDAGITGEDAGATGEDSGSGLDAEPGDCPTAANPEPGVINTRWGPVQGAEANGVWRWLGIPFAAPPVGALRWRAPAEPACYEGTRLVTAAGPECPQYATSPGRPVVGNEDCLSLNVWSPVGSGDGVRRPVLFFVHGGGHEQGGSARALYDGSALAVAEDVLVVSANYRLGPFGFLAHPDLQGPSGNYGMADQIAALEWVRDNIAQFGGDPDRVLVFGQSAGSVSVCRLLASPAARGLFHAAALMSGGCGATPRLQAEAAGVAFVQGLCGADTDVQACLRDLSTEAVMAGFEPLGSGTDTVGRGSWSGMIDGGDLVPEAPRTRIERGEHNRVPVMVGSTREENGRGAPPIQTEAQYRVAVQALYGAIVSPAVIDEALRIYPASAYPSPRAAYVALTSDARFTCPARRDARLLARSQTEPVYRYLFAHLPDRASAALRGLGAWHGIDLFFLFDTLTTTGLAGGPTDREITRAQQAAWSRLAADGRLDDSEGTVWPGYDPTAERLLLLDRGASVVADPKMTECDFWDPLIR